MLHKGRDESPSQFSDPRVQDEDVVYPLWRDWSSTGEALGIRVEKILDGGSRIIIDQKHGAGKYTTTSRLRTENAKLTFPWMWRSCWLSLSATVRRAIVLYPTGHPAQLNQRNILRYLHKALEEVGFEQAGAHSFRRYRNTYLRNFTARPESILDFWLGWSSEGMSAHYDKITRSMRMWRSVRKSRIAVELGSMFRPF